MPVAPYLHYQPKSKGINVSIVKWETLECGAELLTS